MRLVYKLASYGLLIGVIHVALTPMFYPEFNLNAIWFAGTGLALIFLSFLNISAERVPERLILNLCILANFIFLIFSMLIIIILPDVQAWITLALALFVTLGSVSLRMSAYSRNHPATASPNN